MEKLVKKLEQLDGDERKRVYKLLQEDKKPDEVAMTWMYKENKPDNEEYLLGRRVDKHIEGEPEPIENNDVPGASFQEHLARRADMDMQTKMREDPLYAIRKKEEEARRKILENPIKMKQLQKLLHESQKSKAKKNKKEKKKKKKHKKSSSDSDSDDDIVNKYLAILKQKQAKPSPGDPETGDKSQEQSGDFDHSKHRDRQSDRHRPHDSDSSPETRGSRRGNSHKGDPHRGDPHRDYHKRESQRGDSHKGHSHRGDSHPQRHSDPKRGDKHKPPVVKLSTHDCSDSENDAQQKKRSRHDSDSDAGHRSMVAKPYGLIVKGEAALRSSKKERSRSRSPDRSHRSSHSQRTKPRSRSRSPQRSRSSKNQRSPQRRRSRSPPRHQPKKKLSDEEKERRRVEMMENAKWRDEQRAENVRKYHQEAAREKDAHEKQGASSDFLNPMLMEHAAQSSVEDRIKRNKHNVQRTRADLDKNFTKR